MPSSGRHGTANGGGVTVLRSSDGVAAWPQPSPPTIRGQDLNLRDDNAGDVLAGGDWDAGFANVAAEHVAKPYRAVHVFAADPSPDLHVRSNPRPALARVLAAIQGKEACLGDRDELRFVRTLMPAGAPEEGGHLRVPEQPRELGIRGTWILAYPHVIAFLCHRSLPSLAAPGVGRPRDSPVDCSFETAIHSGR